MSVYCIYNARSWDLKFSNKRIFHILWLSTIRITYLPLNLYNLNTTVLPNCLNNLGLCISNDKNPNNVAVECSQNRSVFVHTSHTISTLRFFSVQAPSKSFNWESKLISDDYKEWILILFCFSAFFTDRVFLNFSLLIKWETEDITQYAPIIVHYVLFTSWLLYKLSKCLLCVCVLVLLHYYKLTVCLSWFKVWLKIIYWILNFIELRSKSYRLVYLVL